MNEAAKAQTKPLDGEMKSTGPIVHMRADSDSLLDSMFAFATKPPGSEMPANYKPYRMRKLPDSFFKPPPMGTKSPSCHSRENSHDSSSMHGDPYSPASMNVGSPQTATQATPQRPAPPSHSVSSVQQPHHSRAHSSPATLQPANLVAINIPQSPVQAQQPQQPQAQPQPTPMQQAQPQQMQHHYRQASLDVNLGNAETDPLPTDWDRAVDEKGQVFYRNHRKKTTQWEHPLPPQLQNQGPLPHRWVLSVTPDDEIYYIDHSTESTSWYDPRLPQGQQQVPHKIVTSTGQAAGAHRPALSAGPVGQQNQQRLMQLQLQKRQNEQKQAEIQRMLQQQRLQRNDVNLAQEMLLRSSLNETVQGGDPFLTSSQNNEIHNRQESADSGLGMGSNFNLPGIPEDISGIESMDTGDLDTTLTGDQTNPNQSSAADHLLTSLPDALGEDISTDLMESFLDSNSGGPTNSANSNPVWL